jgi:uncharacterized metal-binding protein
MASGKIHAAATMMAAALSPLVLSSGQVELDVARAGGCLAGLVLTPDLDIERKTHAHSVVARLGQEFGKLLGKRGRLIGSAIGEMLAFAWWAFWWPYGRVVPHRSVWSHGPVIGTLGRLIYLLCLPALMWWLISLAASVSPPQLVLPAYSAPLRQAFWGLVVSDSLHFLFDWMGS